MLHIFLEEWDVAKIGSHDVKLWQCHKIATFKHIHEHQNLSYPSIKRRCGCTCLPFGVCRALSLGVQGLRCRGLEFKLCGVGGLRVCIV